MTPDSMASLYKAKLLSSLINSANATAKEPSLEPKPTFFRIRFKLNTNL